MSNLPAVSRNDLDEETVQHVLTKTRGDLIQSSRMLQCRASTLVDWIKSVPSVGALWSEIEKYKADPAFDNATQAQFEAEIRARSAIYRLDGLEVLHELAMAPHTNASEADVRLKAAIQLRGLPDAGTGGGDGILAELNTLYHSAAPRIKSMRAVQIEFETGPELD